MKPKPDELKASAFSWKEFSAWPVRDVLRPAKIPPGNLGIVIRLGSDSEGAKDPHRSAVSHAASTGFSQILVVFCVLQKTQTARI